MKITPQKFYSLFLKEIQKSGIQFVPWNNNAAWTKKMLKSKDCVMKKVADKLDLLFYNEYFSLDGVFFKNKLEYGKLWYAENIEIILECENNYRTIKTEIYKLFPLFLAPLKVIITYLDGDEDRLRKEEAKIKKVIEDRIKEDNPFKLHNNKIKTLLIFGSKNKEKVKWEAFVYGNVGFKKLNKSYI
jgi:hypothetical protein